MNRSEQLAWERMWMAGLCGHIYQLKPHQLRAVRRMERRLREWRAKDKEGNL